MKLREVSKTEEGIWDILPKFAVVNKNNYRIIAVCCYLDDANYLANSFNERYNTDSYKVMEIIDDTF